MSDNTEQLAKRLPEYIPSGKGSPNYDLLAVIGESSDEVDEHIRDVFDATHVQRATSTRTLLSHGDMVGVSPSTGGSFEKYRSRIISNFALVTSEGTIEDLLNTVSEVFNTDFDKIGYTEIDESGVSILSVTTQALDNLELTVDEVTQLLGKNVAAGNRVELRIFGTFEMLSVDGYNNGNNDSDKGYAALDQDGNPDGSGGTYAGLI